MKILTSMLLLTALSGCTWVKVTEPGQAVQILEPNAVAACKAIGSVTAISRAKVAGISRNQEKLANELETIARNEAAGMGGTAIAPSAAIDGNERVFRVYQCP